MPKTSDPANYWMDCKHVGYLSFEYVTQWLGWRREDAEDMLAETCRHCGRPIKDLRLIDEGRLAGGM